MWRASEIIQGRDPCISCGVPDGMPPLKPGSAATARACAVCGFVEEIPEKEESTDDAEAHILY